MKYKYKMFEKVSYLDASIKGRIIKRKLNEHVGACYLVMYNPFRCLWAFEDSLKKDTK